ncbi:UNVERIFIED_CONTAM: hypothetical protein HHA_453880 [Hammondia hammondi]|eukprot:XP_008887259.1 hypothetical protein HHA_453880 [Hammondia hammondi]
MNTTARKVLQEKQEGAAAGQAKKQAVYGGLRIPWRRYGWAAQGNPGTRLENYGNHSNLRGSPCNTGPTLAAPARPMAATCSHFSNYYARPSEFSSRARRKRRTTPLAIWGTPA